MSERSLPKKFYDSHNPLGNDLMADHPSPFIQKHSGNMMFSFIEEHSVKEFVDYLERRQQIGRLVEILKQARNV